MAIDTISSYSLQQSTLRDVSKVMGDLATQQAQLSSGFKAQDFAGMANESQQFLALDAKMMRNQQYIDDNKVASVRIDDTATALSDITTIATNIRNLVLQRRNSSQAETLGYDEQLNGYWQQLSSLLNTSLNGRYLFSGSKTDTPPVDTSTFPTVDINGTLNSNYYKGSNQNLTLRMDDAVQISYNVRADNPAIEKILAGLAQAKQAPSGSNTSITIDEAFAKAYDLLSEGLDELSAVKANVNSNKVLLSSVTERQNSQQLYWKGIKEELVNTDLISVSTQVSVNQGILTAAFQSFAKINSLRLSDFLR